MKLKNKTVRFALCCVAATFAVFLLRETNPGPVNGTPIQSREQTASSMLGPVSTAPYSKYRLDDLGRQNAAENVRRLTELLNQHETSFASAIFDDRNNITDDREENERAGDHPFEAIKFRNLQLQDENGNIPADGLTKAAEQLKIMEAYRDERAGSFKNGAKMKVANLSASSWTSLGPGNIGGRIRAIAIDPSNAANMWIGSASGGIWHSSDGGNSWLPVDDFLASLSVATIVIDPTNPNIIYAGTGEAFPASREIDFNGNYGVRGAGIFKSTNHGVSWQQLPSTDPADPAVCGGGGPNCAFSYIQRLAISADGSAILAATIQGIWYSGDGGNNWALSQTPVGGSFLDIDFDPSNGQNAIASGVGGAFYSTNGGLPIPGNFSWSLAAFHNESGGNINVTGRVEVAYAPSNPLFVYASVDNNNGEVYRSNDGGKNYTRVAAGTRYFNSLAPCAINNSSQGGYDNTIWVNPQDPNSIVVGGIDLWSSSDASTNNPITLNQISQWCNAGSPHSDQHTMVAAPGFDNVTNKRVYFANDGGLFRTDDISTANPSSGWVNLNNGLANTQFWSAAANSAGVIIGGTQDNGTPRYTPPDPIHNVASFWSAGQGLFGGDGGFTAADPTDTNYFYGEYITLQIYRSTDGGVTASSIFNGISDATCTPPPGGSCNASANFVAPFVLDPSNANTMLAGGLSLWRSTNVKGSTPLWSPIEPPILPRPPSPNPNATPPISALAISPSNSAFIVVGHNDGQIYLTQDGTGNNPPNIQQCAQGFSPCWARIDNAATPQRFVTKLVIDDSKSPNRIYATFGGFNNDNIYRTDDLGVTWTKVTGAGATALPSVPVHSLAINPANPNLLYAGTEVGLFASEDAGATWQLPQGGPARVSVDDQFFQNGNLVAVTHGRGLFTTQTPVFDLPMCTQSPNCQCAGRTDCPCSYPNNQLPGPTDDVYIACPMTGPGIQVRNLRVESRLDLENGDPVNVSGDIINNGLIDTLPGAFNSLFATNVSNLRPPHQVSEKGIINLNGDISATGNVDDGGMITVTGEVAANNVYVAASDGFAGSDASLAANFLSVKGSIFNNGTINTSGSNGGIAVSSNGVPTTHVLSGTGTWQASGLFGVGETTQIGNDLTINAQTFSIGGGATFQLQSYNMTFNGRSFEVGGASGVGGILDVGSATLFFNGTDHFYASTPSFSGDLGSVVGTGRIILQPADGSAEFRDNVTNGLFQPNLEIRSGTIEAQNVFVGSDLDVDQGARLNLNGGTSTVQGNVNVQGTVGKASSGATTTTFNFNGHTFNNSGSFLADTVQFNVTGLPLSQQLAGTGSWPRASRISFGTSTSPSTVTLQDDITLGHDRLSVPRDSILDLQDHTLTYAGLDASPLSTVQGSSAFKMAPANGPANIAGVVNSSLQIASGIVTANGLTSGGPITIDAGSTLNISGGGVFTTGNVTVNGTLKGNNSALGLGGNNFFTNNGTVDSGSINFGSGGGAQKNQQFGGAGAWIGTTGRIFVGSESTVTLTSDVTYNGPQLYLDGRIDTSTFTLTLPCSTTWQGAGDVVGNLRRTNLAACPGPIAFGNPFTTITFDSGTPPTEITVHTLLSPPLGFPNSVSRSYTITPVGGSNYVATLRLHYLDSELNGNDENTLQLFRNDGTVWSLIGVTARDTTNNWVEYAGVTQFSPWTISSDPPTGPTAAPISVSGRVITTSGIGVAGVRVTVSSLSGVSRSTLTTSFGTFRFDRLPAGAVYIVSVRSSRFTFSQTSQMVTAFDDVKGVDFVAQPE